LVGLSQCLLTLIILKNPKKDTALIAIAGPCSNLILAIVFSIVLRLLNLFDSSFLITIGNLIIPTIIKLNLALAFFNLFPVSPLDGYNFVSGFLSEENYEEWQHLQRYGMLFLLIMIIPIFNGSSMISFILNPIVGFFSKLLIPSSLIGTGII
jgi:Zn-dependent protease